MGRLVEASKKIENLARGLSEVYQDVILDGKKILSGVRECEERWNIISAGVPIMRHDVVLDLGSSEGYFSHRIASEFPDSLVVSVECNPALCEIQKAVLRAEGIYNVVVLNRRLSIEDLRKWSSCVECFDVVLALSVLHHFPAENLGIVVDALRLMPRSCVTEVPAEREGTACGGNSKEAARWLVRNDDILGVSPSHLLPVNRTIRVHRHVCDERHFLNAYMGVPHEDRNRFTVTLEGKIEWMVRASGSAWNRHMIPGVNVWNLLQMGPIVWPPRNWWITQAIQAYDGLEYKSDVRLWNLLVTSSGLRAIDYLTEFPPGDQAEFRTSDYDEMIKQIVGGTSC